MVCNVKFYKFPIELIRMNTHWFISLLLNQTKQWINMAIVKTQQCVPCARPTLTQNAIYIYSSIRQIVLFCTFSSTCGCVCSRTMRRGNRGNDLWQLAFVVSAARSGSRRLHANRTQHQQWKTRNERRKQKIIITTTINTLCSNIQSISLFIVFLAAPKPDLTIAKERGFRSIFCGCDFFFCIFCYLKI